MKINHNKIFEYYQLAIYPNYDKIYVIGDIHGDFTAFINVLKKAKLIDNEYHWIGGNSHVVQIGDILDRKIRDCEYSDEDSEFKIISLICNLQLEAYLQNGGFHPIIGNHELMNILGIFDYVSNMGFSHFKTIEGRKEYFKIGNYFCKYLACSWNPVIKIGSFIFCHGGISLNIALKYKINDINLIMRDTLYGNIKHLDKPYFTELFLNQSSILWNRDFSVDATPYKTTQLQKDVDKILELYDCTQIFLGHTPHDNIKSRFKGKVICIDTGMSEAFGKKNSKMDRIHYVAIINNKINHI